MKLMTKSNPMRRIAGSLALAGLVTSSAVLAQDASFFVTSAGSGNGADLGGLEGADAHCQSLAEAAGHGGSTWRAYLSTQGDDAVNARDRIGSGPWYSVNGDLIANNLDELHQDSVNVTHETAVDENGDHVPYVHLQEDGTAIPPEEQPEWVEHDILTGTQADGTAFGAGEDVGHDPIAQDQEDHEGHRQDVQVLVDEVHDGLAEGVDQAGHDHEAQGA